MKILFKGQDVWEIVEYGYANGIQKSHISSERCPEGTKEDRWKTYVLHTPTHA